MKRGSQAHVTCLHCDKTYLFTPRGPDTVYTDGTREHGDIDLRYDVTLPRWDDRVVALCFKARNEIEAMHSELTTMGVLPDGRGGDAWRSLTGDFRHALCYGLAHLIWNIRVEYNLNQKTEREQYTWSEGFAGFNRNQKKLARQAELAEKLAPKREGRKPRRAPKYKRQGNHVANVPHAINREHNRELGIVLSERAAADAARSSA